MRIVFAASLAALPLLLAGCGSLSSRWNGNYGPYVGVKLDIDQVTHYETEGEVIAALDIPLSALADTLFLPYDLSRPDRKANENAGVVPNEERAQTDTPPPSPAASDRVGSQ
jgi:uncharacterized protein YceK